MKLFRRYEKELQTLDYIKQKSIDSENELVQAIADYMPLGTGLFLKGSLSTLSYNDGIDDYTSGFFLGDVKWGNNNKYSGYGVITR